jgi:hypothetical protein
MAAKKKRAAPRRARGETVDGAEAAHAMLTMIATHEATIRKLAEVVVNLHANVRALRDVVEPLASTTIDERVAKPLRTLRRTTLDE